MDLPIIDSIEAYNTFREFKGAKRYAEAFADLDREQVRDSLEDYVGNHSFVTFHYMFLDAVRNGAREVMEGISGQLVNQFSAFRQLDSALLSMGTDYQTLCVEAERLLTIDEVDEVVDPQLSMYAPFDYAHLVFIVDGNPAPAKLLLNESQMIYTPDQKELNYNIVIKEIMHPAELIGTKIKDYMEKIGSERYTIILIQDGKQEYVQMRYFMEQIGSLAKAYRDCEITTD